MSLEHRPLLIHFAPDQKSSDDSGRESQKKHVEVDLSILNSREERINTINTFISRVLDYCYYLSRYGESETMFHKYMQGEYSQNMLNIKKHLPPVEYIPGAQNQLAKFAFSAVPRTRPTLSYLPVKIEIAGTPARGTLTLENGRIAAVAQAGIKLTFRAFAGNTEVSSDHPLELGLTAYIDDNRFGIIRADGTWESADSKQTFSGLWQQFIIDKTSAPDDLFEVFKDHAFTSSRGRETILINDEKTFHQAIGGAFAELTETLIVQGINPQSLRYKIENEGKTTPSNLFPEAVVFNTDIYKEVILTIRGCTFSAGKTEFYLEREQSDIQTQSKNILLPTYTFTKLQAVTSNKKLVGYLRRSASIAASYVRFKDFVNITLIVNEGKEEFKKDKKFFAAQMKHSAYKGALLEAEYLNNPFQGGLPGQRT